MTLWVCSGENGCGTKYAVQLYGGCPNCRNNEFHEEGSVPKITNATGPSIGDHLASGDEGETPQVETPATPPEGSEAPPGGVADGTGDGQTSGDDEAPVEPPKRNASKDEWVVFVEANGFDQNAELYTRDELIAWWDQR